MSVAENLQSSISSLENSINFLNCAIDPLRQVTDDVDRFKVVLRTKAVFDVIPEAAVQKRTNSVNSLVEPRLNKDHELLREIMSDLARKQDRLYKQVGPLEKKLQRVRSQHGASLKVQKVAGTREEIARLNSLRAKKLKLASRSV
ncbi:hypothetical protein OGAPHI_002149 [Ogataea philodendri]|uniref:DASH complex subunit SPC19 n=1 Tax=Ogataea philodendri TaxID=1378263 RepID=A0A9P8PB93_9ASCO|nr:uncharacterized protein OGAPHI_002149 [Ogataea philodendri]KAH3668395.1 hypothetical protein OGAPHI_002149 [Ogataea philodendri]